MFVNLIQNCIMETQTDEKMAPGPYSDKSPIQMDSSNDVTSGTHVLNISETPSPPTYRRATPSFTPQELVTIEPFIDPVEESNRAPNYGAAVPCYPTPGDIMPYDHSLPDFIKQITNQSNLSNLHSLSLRVISTLISLHRMSSYLPNLRCLDLEGSVLNSLRDIGCSFKNLEILKVGRCQLESLDGTFGLSSLRELYAQKNFITDISPCSNLPHIRHIDVSGNRICNISYAGFLSVCSKLKSIVLTGNPATQMSGYRKQVRRILPQLETLDDIPFIIEDDVDIAKESDVMERYTEPSDRAFAEVPPNFSSVSPSDGLNNFSDAKEGLFFLDQKNKQAKNLANQDQCEDRQDDFYKEYTKATDIRSTSTKQRCAGILKLDKDNENRSKKTNLLSSEKFSELPVFFSEVSASPVLEKNFSISSEEGASIIIPSIEENSKRRLTALESLHTCYSGDSLRGRINADAMRKKTSPGIPESQISAGEQMIDREFGEPSELTKGSPICGNLAAALRNRKKALNPWNEKQNFKCSSAEEVRNERSQKADGVKKFQVQNNEFGGCCATKLDIDGIDEKDLIEEDILATSRKWREAFRHFRSNNRARWEEESESDFSKLFREASDLNAEEK